jgi:O-succinylbenzoic acid--CoA ligase
MILDFLNKQDITLQDNPAITCNQIKLNYNEFKEKILQCASQLMNLGIQSDDHVALLSDNNIEFIIILFALWEISAIPIPLNIRLKEEELNELIIHSNSEIILVHNNLKEKLIYSDKKIIFPLKNLSHPKIISPGNKFDENKTALILYTSGTTTSPKGVMHSFHDLINNSESSNTFFQFNQKDRWLVCLPLYHIGGIQILMRAIIFGSELIIPNSLKTEDIIDAMCIYNPTLISIVQTTLTRLVEKDVNPNPKLRCVILGGGPGNDKIVKDAVEKGWKIVKVYGSTETVSMITAFSVNDNPNKIKSAGKLLGTNLIKIVDENGNLLLPNQTGEIVVSGESIMQGYWNNPVETNKRLINNEYFTNDFGYLDEDGFLYIASRRDDLIISGGENINPIEIEEAILSLPDIKNVCVVGLENNEWGQIVAAAIVQKKTGAFSSDRIIELLKPKLASYKLPKRILFVDDLPITSLGKIKLEEVRRLFQQT